jgi:hypothetical protein
VVQHTAAQHLLGQFARPISSHVLDDEEHRQLPSQDWVRIINPLLSANHQSGDGGSLMSHPFRFRFFAPCIVATAAEVCFLAPVGPTSPADEPASRGAINPTDPQHLWNRLHEALFVRAGPDGRTYGQDRLEPLLWPESKYLLEERPNKRATAALEEFLQKKGEKLIDDPLKRALLQRDLWLVFNWLEGSHDGFAAPALDAEAVRTARERLRRPLAAVIGRLALSPKEILELSDNYVAAVASGRFARRFDADKPGLPYLPPELFAADGPWVCVGRTDGITAPEHLREDRDHRFNNSALLVFLRLPGGRAATAEYLKHLPPFPKGTEVALVRRALLIDASHRVAASPLTESVQLRVGDVPAEFRLSREQLFVGRTSGLRPVGPDERDFKTGFGAHRWDEFEYRQEGRSFPDASLQPVKQLCSACHTRERFPDLRSGSPDDKGAKPRPDLLEEMSVAAVGAAAVKWKEQQANWIALRKLLAE